MGTWHQAGIRTLGYFLRCYLGLINLSLDQCKLDLLYWRYCMFEGIR